MTLARRVFGFLLWLFCLWLLITSLKPMLFQLRQTGDLTGALVDPVFFMPLAGATLGLIGGLIILAGGPGGAVLGLVGGAIYAIYAIGVLVSGGDEEMWFPKCVFAGIESVLALGAFRLPRRLN